VELANGRLAPAKDLLDPPPQAGQHDYFVDGTREGRKLTPVAFVFDLEVVAIGQVRDSLDEGEPLQGPGDAPASDLLAGHTLDVD
jgi:hypothetical protein